MLDKIKTTGIVLVGCACVYVVGKAVTNVTGFVVEMVCDKVFNVVDKKGKAE